VKNAPTKEEIENCWKEVYGNNVQRNEEAYCINNQCQQNPSMEWSPVSEKVTTALRATVNCKVSQETKYHISHLSNPQQRTNIYQHFFTH
jgi:hypothetical protein